MNIYVHLVNGRVGTEPVRGDETSPDLEHAEITLGLLTAVDRDRSITQRRLAHDLGIALGLANAYIKRAAKKGLIKIAHAPTRRYGYYLTPKGFAEKSRLTAEFLSQSFKLFRLARQQYAEIFARCIARGGARIAIYGGGDLADIVLVCARDAAVTVVGMVDQSISHTNFGVQVVRNVVNLEPFDFIVVADLKDPQHAYNLLVTQCGPDKVMAPAFLNITVDGAEQWKARP